MIVVHPPIAMAFDQLEIGSGYRYPGGVSQFVKIDQHSARLDRGKETDRVFCESPWISVMLVRHPKRCVVS